MKSVQCHFDELQLRDITLSVEKKKGKDLTQSYDKSPTEMSNGQSDNTKNATKSSITQRLLTDLGRSVKVTTANKLETNDSISEYYL